MNLLDQFISILTAQQPTPSHATVKNYKADIAKFITWYEATYGQFSPQSITPQTLKAYKIAMTGQTDEGQSLAIRSFERYLSSLRKFFNFLKVSGHVEHSPFEVENEKSKMENTDPYHLKGFRDHLYVFNASDLTIKNYIMDVKQFFSWAETVLKLEDLHEVSQRNIFKHINATLLEEYKERLHHQAGLSPVSINRKLSSLRRYLTFAKGEGLIATHVILNSFQDLKEKHSEILKQVQHDIPAEILVSNYNNTDQISPDLIGVGNDNETVIPTSRYSKIPPIRLIQRIGHLLNLGFEATLIAPLAALTIKLEYLKWQLMGGRLFVRSMRTTAQNQEVTGFGVVSRRIPLLSALSIGNYKKSFYAPHAISLQGLPLHKKIWHHARYTRPKWYKRYHENAITHYFHSAILIIVMTALGVGMYQAFVSDPAKNTVKAAPVAPPRILSFQGRLTDASDNPITSLSQLRFAIYNDPTASGGALLWEEVNSITPDTDGIFSLLLGNNTTIPQSLFGDNAALWLGITVESTDELAPRQQIATVPYATNSELLQGMAPITQVGAGTTNVILALNSSGNLAIGGAAAPIFQATGGTFTLEGTTTVISTVTGSGGNVIVAPDGLGKVDIQKPIFNSTNNNNILGAAGSVEINDSFSVLGTTSASLVTLEQQGGGSLITASVSGVTKFTVLNSGQLSIPVYNTPGGMLYGTSTGLIAQTAAGTAAECLKGGTTPAFGTCGSATWWDQTNGALYPLNSTVDLLIGGQSTVSAKFAVLNMNTGTPTASVSANSGNNATFLTGLGNLGTTNAQSLTIGGTTTGNISLMPRNGVGNVGIGTTTPLRMLHINDSTGATAQLRITSTNAPAFEFDSPGSADDYRFATHYLGSGDDFAIVDLSTGGNGTGRLAITNGNVGIGGAVTVSGGAISGANFTVMNAGNVGVGDVTPDSLFAVGSTSQFQVNSSGAIAAATGITSSGNITFSGLNGNNAVLYGTTSTGLVAQATTSTANLCLISGASATYTPSWATCATGTEDWWDQTNGLLHAANTTVDFALGGTSTTSAKFAVLNMNTGTPVASISAGATGGTYLTADGTLATTNRQTLTLGNSATYNTTGNILLNPNGTGNVGIGTTAPSVPLQVHSAIDVSAKFVGTVGTTSIRIQPASGTYWDMVGASGGWSLEASDTPVVTVLSAGNVGIGITAPLAQLHVGTGGTPTIAGAGDGYFQNDLEVDGVLNVGGAVTFGNYTTNGGLLYTNGSGLIAQTGAGSSALCLKGGTTPTYGACDDYWVQANGALYPLNSTVDLLVGGQSTASAKFAVLNMNTGTPTASISSGVSGSSMYMTADGTLATQNRNSLTIGNSATYNTTGHVLINPNGSGNLGIGTTNPGNIVTASLNQNTGTSIQTINLNSGSGALAGFTGTSDAGGAFFGIGSIAGGSLTYVYSSSGPLVFFTANTQRAILTSAGNLGIGIGAPLAMLHVGTGGTPTIASTGDGYFQNDLEVDGVLNVGGVVTIANYTVNGGLLYTNGSGVVAQTSAGSATQCLNGGTTPSFGSCGFWDQQNGTLYPYNATVDLLVGGQSSASAKFAFINVNSGTPTASIAGNLAIAAPTGANPATTYNVLNGGTFNLRQSPGGDAGLTSRLFVNANGNVGIGTTTPGFLLEVGGNARVNGSTTLGDASGDAVSFNAATLTMLNATTLDLEDASQTALRIETNLMNFDTLNSRIGIGTTTPTAKLDVNGAASVSASLSFRNGAASIVATQMNNLTLGDSATGNVIINPSGNIGIGTTTPAFKLDVTGTLRVSGTTTFNTVTYTWPGADGSSGYALSTNGSGTLSWSPTSGFGTNYWDLTNGALYPKISTVDLLVGGTSTASAKFAVLNMNSGTPVASVSSGVSGNGMYMTADGTLATTRRQTLTIGNSSTYNTTGNILLNPNGTGNVGIGTTSPTGKLTINTGADTLTIIGQSTTDTNYNTITLNGNMSLTGTVGLQGGGTGDNSLYVLGADGIRFGTSGGFEQMFLSTAGNLGIGTTTPTAATLQVVGSLNVSGAATFGSTTTLNSLTYTWPGSQTTGYVLQTNGSGTLTWVDPNIIAEGANYWVQLNGSLFPKNSTVDLLIGGQSTASAKFAVLNMNSGTPTASVSAGATGGTYLTADGNLGTTAMQPLTLGTTSTGDIRTGTGKNFLAGVGTGKIGLGGPVSTSDYFMDITLDSTQDWSRGINITQTNNADETSSALTITNTAAPGTIAAGRTVANATLNLTPTASITGGNSLNTYGINNTVTASNISIGTTGTGNVMNTYGELITVTGTPTMNNSNSNQNISGYGTLSSILLNPTLTAVGGASAYITYGGYFQNSSSSGGHANLGSSAYGIRAFANGALTTTGDTAHYGGNFGATNTAANNYGLFITTVSGATNNFGLYVETTAPSYFAGNVGIGTTTPGNLLEVAGSLPIISLSNTGTGQTSVIRFKEGATDKFGIGTDINVAGVNDFFIYDYVASLARLFIDANGNVGIGNTAPSSFKLQTTGSIGPDADDTYDLGSNSLRWRDLYLGPASLHVGSDITDEGVISYDTTGNIFNFGTDSTTNGDIAFFTDDLYLDKSTSNVGIGITNPGFLLEVNGTARINGNTTIGDASGDSLTINAATLSMVNASTLDLVNSQTSALNIESGLMNFDTTNSRVGIGLTNPAQKLDVVGNFKLSGTTTFNSLTYTWPASQSLGYVLQTDGSGNLVWQDPNVLIGAANYWDQNLGALYPKISTVDLLIGGTSTASAKFAVLNMNSGTPTASISANSGNIATYIKGDGTLATTNRQTLTLGNSALYNTTGNILLNPNGTGNVGIGTTNPTNKLTVQIGSAGDGFSVIGNSAGVLSPQFSLNDTTTQKGAYGLALDNNHYSSISLAGDTVMRALNAGGSGGNVIISAQNGTGGIKFATGNSSADDTAKMVILNNGNIGIGITTPIAKLDVRGTLGTAPAASISARSNSFAGLVVDNAGTGDIFTASSSGLTRFVIKNNGRTGINTSLPANALDVYDSPGVGGAVAATTFKDITGTYFLTPAAAGTSLVVAGNVGIGTTAPNTQLMLNIGNTSTFPQLKINQTSTGDASMFFGADSAVWAMGLDNSDSNKFKISNDAAGADVGTSTRLTIQTDGNVGIGTTAPSSNLELLTTSSAVGAMVLRIKTGDTATPYISFSKTSSNDRGWIQYYHGATTATESLRLAAGQTETVTILGNGLVGIGTTAPGGLFEIKGSDPHVLVNSTNTSAFLDFKLNGTNKWQTGFDDNFGTDGYFIYDNTDSVYRFGINTTSNYLLLQPTNGNVGIGNTAPGRKLDVTGDIALSNQIYGAGSAGTYGALSINGTGGTWGGLNFRSGTTNYGTFMIQSDYSGVYNNTDNGWDWYWTNGVLSAGSVPAAQVTAGTLGSGTYTISVASDIQNMVLSNTSTGQTTANIVIFDSKTKGTGFAFADWYATCASACDRVFFFRGDGAAYNEAGWFTGADFAEYFETDDTTLTKGELIAFDPNNSKKVIRATKENMNRAIGVVSTKPGFVGIYADDITDAAEERENHPNWRIVGLQGQIPTFVSAENGPIQAGDYLTASSIPGVAMKATQPGRVVGKAMENYAGPGTAKIQSYISATYADPQNSMNMAAVDLNGTTTIENLGIKDVDSLALISTAQDLGLTNETSVQNLINKPTNGNLTDITNTIIAVLGAQNETPAGMTNLNLTSTGNLAITSTPDPLRYEVSKDGTVFTQIAALSDAWIANLKVGSLDVKKMSIAGEDIRGYIVRIVQEALDNGEILNQFQNDNGELVSPIATIDRVYTNALSPIPSGNGAIEIDGNLKISGNLLAQSATISGNLSATDASFSGTLRAKNIIADNIEGLNATIATLAAHTVTNITNVYQSTGSGSTGTTGTTSTTGDFYTGDAASRSALLASLGLLDQQNYFSSTSANLGTLIADFGTFNQGLLAMGPSSFTDVSVSGQFSVGSLYLNDNSINTLGADLEIQPLAQGGVRIMGGKISINTNGDVQFGENAEFAKNVRVNGKLIGKVISPIPDEDLVIELGTDGLGDSRFLVKNATGSAVFAVNQAGDISASGSASFAKLNLNVIKPAMATGAGDLIAFDSAGVATISATRSEITIHSNLVTEKSLIYITPIGTPSATGTYLMRQVAGQSFTVGGVAGAVFNWLIIN